MHDHRLGRESRAQRLDVPHVLLVEREPREPPHVPQVPLLHGARVEPVEVVDAYDLVFPARERLDQVRADEPGRPGDEDTRHRPARPIP